MQPDQSTNKRCDAEAEASHSLEPPLIASSKAKSSDGKKTWFKPTIFQSHPRRWHRISHNTWIWEIAGISVCVACLISIIGILLAYDQKPQPRATSGISLTATIAILATISRAAVLFVAASVIAQQKWIKFVKSKNSLSIISRYDDATRGPLGSFALLVAHPKSAVVMIVAAITVLALGFEPFVQQSLKLPLRNLELKGTSSILRASTTITQSQLEIASNVSLIYNSILLQGLYSDVVAPLQPSCTGSSCDWPMYYTASVCSSCTDAVNETTLDRGEDQSLHYFATTDYLDDFQGFSEMYVPEEQKSDTLSLVYPIWQWNSSTNYTVTVGDSPPVDVPVNVTAVLDLSGYLSQTLSYPEELVFDATKPRDGTRNMSGPYSTLGYLKFGESQDGLRLEIKAATKCTISLCAKELVSTLFNGSLGTQVKEQTWGEYFPMMGSTSFGYNWTATLGNHTFQVLDKILPGQSTNANIYPIVQLLDRTIISLGGQSLRSQKYAGGVRSSFLTDPPSNTQRFITGPMQNSSARIAQAFTNYFQQNGDTLISGKVYTVVTFVDVHWAWLIFPLAIVLICFANLIITIYQSRLLKLPIWRTSPYPLLFSWQMEDNRPRATVYDVPAVVSATGRDPASGDRIPEEQDRSSNSVGVSRPLLKRSVAINEYSISALESVARGSMVQLKRTDGRWMFETSDVK
ncbi:hypothetical protein LTR84_002111 [Exophiala bonariae]|uniref:Uncharacterized protein n=1 Tax=Exophiala bonariae TaxID=1690606 RepID=A0AAV9NCN5_9EURO|nr:hypothetical protein LTR84_002111 [Exophiala bonariae]